jgi:hypothetical protein
MCFYFKCHLTGALGLSTDTRRTGKRPDLYYVPPVDRNPEIQTPYGPAPNYLLDATSPYYFKLIISDLS